MKKQSIRKFSVSLALGPETQAWFEAALADARGRGVDGDLTAVVRGTLLKGMRATQGEVALRDKDGKFVKLPLSTHH